MSGGFLGRWSQRKLSDKENQVRTPADPPQAAPEYDPDDPHAVASQNATLEDSVAAQEAESLSEEELASLPPLDSITTQTDLRQFLRKGVPGTLKNAALRKMWLLDPAIRNHVDYAVDYAWDWNVPGGVPGHGGKIAGESVARMLDKLLPRQVADANAADAAPVTPDGARSEAEAVSPEAARAMPDAGDASIGEADEKSTKQIADSPEPDPAERTIRPRTASDRQVVSGSDAMSRLEDGDAARPRRHGGAIPT